jgi:hypothetical protein
MTKKHEKRVKFAIEEIVLSFVGALVLTFGLVFAVNGGMTNLVIATFSIWLGLLLFVVPMVRKLEELM